jgi:hypothetical protein
VGVTQRGVFFQIIGHVNRRLFPSAWGLLYTPVRRLHYGEVVFEFYLGRKRLLYYNPINKLKNI